MGKLSVLKSQLKTCTDTATPTDALLTTLDDFTSKQNWDKFFTIRGADNSFEWYAEWPQLKPSLLPHISSSPSAQILVPGCGNSRLSEHVYDAGFKGITNVDFSQVVISDMLRRNIRERPGMRWRVMDMTHMKFEDETFDAVIDKGGLDALMEPELGLKLGSEYLSEVKRVLKSGGKFICLTLAESHVLGLLFPMFRFGWKVSIHAITQKPSNKSSLRTFMVVAEKESSTAVYPLVSSFVQSKLDCDGKQASGLNEAIENEERIRKEYSSDFDISYSLEDLHLGAEGDLTKYSQGRRFQFSLGRKGTSHFNYKAVLLDAKEHHGPFSFHCAVFIVPQVRVHEWLFSSEEGQWQVVESSKAARLIIVFLEFSHAIASMDDIQKDLSPLIKELAPGEDDPAQIPFMMASDGIKQRNVLHQALSPLSGPIVVEDVVYENVDDDIGRFMPSRDIIFRRLIFQRTEGLVQSEALLTEEGPHISVTGIENKKVSSSKSKKRGSQTRHKGSSKLLSVYHNYLASTYHTGIISGFALISSYLENLKSAGKSVNAVVIGLGAGLLPMFLHQCMAFMKIEVVELDPTVFTIAKGYFSFVEDKFMQVQIADGVQYIKDIEKLVLANGEWGNKNEDVPHCSSGSVTASKEKETSKIDILIIDVDSSDSSSGLTCPAAAFIEESFLLAVKHVLAEQGLFIINLVSRSTDVKKMVLSRLNAVFTCLYSLQLEEDVNEVIFALGSGNSAVKDFPETIQKLEKLLSLKHPEMSQNIMKASKKIIRLK